MKCDEAKQYIMEYIDGELPSGKIAALKKHLRKCPECSAEYEEQKRLAKRLQEMPRLHAPIGFADGVTRAINRRNAFAGWLRRYGSMAAAIAMTVGVAALIMKNHRHDSSPCLECSPQDTARYDIAANEYGYGASAATDEKADTVLEKDAAHVMPPDTQPARRTFSDVGSETTSEQFTDIKTDLDIPSDIVAEKEPAAGENPEELPPTVAAGRGRESEEAIKLGEITAAEVARLLEAPAAVQELAARRESKQAADADDEDAEGQLEELQFYMTVVANDPRQSAQRLAELLREMDLRVLSEPVFRGYVLNVSKLEDGEPVGLSIVQRREVMEAITNTGEFSMRLSARAMSNIVRLPEREAMRAQMEAGFTPGPLRMVIYITPPGDVLLDAIKASEADETAAEADKAATEADE